VTKSGPCSCFAENQKGEEYDNEIGDVDVDVVWLLRIGGGRRRFGFAPGYDRLR
jgi:hypothetical protein